MLNIVNENIIWDVNEMQALYNITNLYTNYQLLKNIDNF